MYPQRDISNEHHHSTGSDPTAITPPAVGHQLVTNSSTSSPFPGLQVGAGERRDQTCGAGAPWLLLTTHPGSCYLPWRGAPGKLREGEDFLQMFPLWSRKLDSIVSNRRWVLWEAESSFYWVRWSGSKKCLDSQLHVQESQQFHFQLLIIFVSSVEKCLNTTYIQATKKL